MLPLNFSLITERQTTTKFRPSQHPHGIVIFAFRPGFYAHVLGLECPSTSARSMFTCYKKRFWGGLQCGERPITWVFFLRWGRSDLVDPLTLRSDRNLVCCRGFGNICCSFLAQYRLKHLESGDPQLHWFLISVPNKCCEGPIRLIGPPEPTEIGSDQEIGRINVELMSNRCRIDP